MSQRRLLLTTDVVGGVWDFALTLGAAVQPAWVPTLLVIGEPSAAQRDAAAQADMMLLSQDLKLEWMADSAGDVARARKLVADVAREIRADVVHANQFAAACADVDVPVVLTLHSDVLSWRRWTAGAEGVPTEWLAYADLVQEALARAGAVVAVSTFLANEIRSLYKSDRAIDVVHNGWPASSGPTLPAEPISLVAGRLWDAAKNVTLAASAARQADVGHVYLAGEQRHPETGQPAEVPAPLEPLGFLSRSQLNEWLDRAAIYVSPARYDPFGLLPLQAALRGCALLLSDIPSYRELWDGAGCFFRRDDVGDLIDRWHMLRSDHEMRRMLAAAAQQRATARFGMRRVADAYTALYASARARVTV